MILETIITIALCSPNCSCNQDTIRNPHTIFGDYSEHNAYPSLSINAEDAAEVWQKFSEAWVTKNKTLSPVSLVTNKNAAVFVLNQPDSMLYIEIPMLQRMIGTIAGQVPVTDYYDEYVKYWSVHVQPIYETDRDLDPVEVIALAHIYYTEDGCMWVVTGDFYADKTILSTVTKFKLEIVMDVPNWVKQWEVVNCCPERY